MYSVEELPVDCPIGVVRADVAFILVDEVGRIANYQVPAFALGYAPQVVGLVNQDPTLKVIQLDGFLQRVTAAGFICQAKRFA
ncbi:hypothetical protein CVM73_33615 [Bradyrhizobium forestalis]|uniref:Uncharacterized protein n=1 Tax=Bradyrhizobium forestalis TaxID=1419263 RepID=A0A2M8QZD9_9BRAD|nr:hypothetical protein CVM73_33615 [Bradyrhizobium forestalis]